MNDLIVRSVYYDCPWSRGCVTSQCFKTLTILKSLTLWI
jgi:hypothetical protein